ncbi:gag-aspartyl protease domain-containing protein [Tanacetum coccineum]
MDDFKVVLGLEFLDKVRAFPMPFANSLCILDDGKTCMVSKERDAKSGAKTLSSMQFKKGFNKSEPCYFAGDEGQDDVVVSLGMALEQVLRSLPDGLGPMPSCEFYTSMEDVMDELCKEKAIQDWDHQPKVTEWRSFLEKQALIWDESAKRPLLEFEDGGRMEEPVLRYWIVTMPFELHTDARTLLLEEFLMQDGHPIAFESQKLNETERKYTV